MNDRRALRKISKSYYKKRIGLGSHLLNFISADGVVRFHYPNKYGESIVRQVISRVLETGNSFFILILSLFRCLFKSILPVRDSTKSGRYVVIGKELIIVETAKTHMDSFFCSEKFTQFKTG
jgi:hypothetical protein